MSKGIFLSIQNKKTWEVDLVGPLKNFIQETYESTGDSNDNLAALNELNKLRSNIILKADDKHESALEAIYRYYDQLSVIDGKFPMSENQIRISFKWQDAFDKETFFGGKKTLTISSGRYEMVCVLFNMAAMQSQVAEAQTLSTDDGLKMAAKLFQQSSGILGHMKGMVPSAVPIDPTPDLRPDTLNALSALMLAQAQDCFVRKAANDKMKSLIVAKLCVQCSELYGSAFKLLQMESIKMIWPKEWLSSVAGKQSGYHSMAEYYRSLVDKDAKDFGFEISRLKKSKELMMTSEMRSGAQFIFHDLQKKVLRALADATKDNDLIYHAKIPEWSSLQPIDKAVIAKATPFAPPLSKQFKDLFESIVPLSVHQSVVAFENRRMVVVNTQIGRLREATQLLNGVLASMNLPAALEDLGGEEVPRSVLQKAEEVRKMGGFDKLNSLMTELPMSLQRNKEILDESDNMLDDEQRSDEQLREQFKERWTRTPSTKLTESIRSEASKYRTIINNAINSDAVVKERFAKHREGIRLLSLDSANIKSSLPMSGPNASLGKCPAVVQLQALMKQLDGLKSARDQLEQEVKNTAGKENMASQFLSALVKDGAINEEELSQTHLDNLFQSSIKRVNENLNKQEELLTKVQAANNEFMEPKKSVNVTGVQREEKLKSLASAFDGFTELKSNLEEGTKFYNDLTVILLKFQSKVSDLCFARKTEKDECMKDLNSSIARQPSTTAPPAPQYQHNDTTPKSEPPARPPPPNFTTPPETAPAAPAHPQPQHPTYASSPGYPAQGAAGAPPYPAYNMPYPPYQPPMPPGYNPYFQYPQQAPYNQPYPHPNYPPQPYHPR